MTTAFPTVGPSRADANAASAAHTSAATLAGLWPAGTTAFILRTWIALALALYVAFSFQLTGASSAAVSVLILAQPAQGMVLSKAFYRLLGTLFGCVVGICMTAAFPQDRTMLLAVFTLYMALQTAFGSMLRDFRSYGCILAGYTVAIVSISNLDSPDTTFDTAVNRVAAIVVSILALAATNFFLAGAESSRALLRTLRGGLQNILAAATKAIDDREPPSPTSCLELAGQFIPLRSEISYASPELPDGKARAQGARSALLGLLEMVSAIQAIGFGLRELRTVTPLSDQACGIAKKALHLQRPHRCLAELHHLAKAAVARGHLSIEEAFLIDRLDFMIQTLVEVRDGLRSVRNGRTPSRIVHLSLHQDGFGIFLNALRVIVAVGAVSVLSILSGWTETAQAVLFTAVFVSLSAVQPDPRIIGKTALFGMPAVVIVGSIYSFFVFPKIEGFSLFIIALAPIVVATCWLVMRGLGGAGLIFGSQSIVLTSPANVQTLNPDTFVATASMLVVSGVIIFAATFLILPVQPAQRRLRLALAVGTALRRALADEGRRTQPRASAHYDRLAQFKTWQRGTPVTKARHKTMQRMADLGNLAYAVRRTWRALDLARPYIGAEVDADARKTLPRLDPVETRQLAITYLDAAEGWEGEPVLALVHAAAALYGTSLLTRHGARLLRRVELLNRGVP